MGRLLWTAARRVSGNIAWWHTRLMPRILSRFSASIPDAITAAFYFTAWVAPSLLGPQWVRSLLAAIVIEFLVMHASAFYGFGIAKRDDRLSKRAAILGILTCAYLVPITAIAIFMQTIAPVLSFIWLFTSRFAFILLNPATATEETKRVQWLWAASIVTYFAGVILTNKLPLPALGLTPDFVASLSISGHPNPNAQPPQLTIAFGLLYFVVQACAKFYFAGFAAPQAKGADPEQIATLSRKAISRKRMRKLG
jgi:hypothetical protein